LQTKKYIITLLALILSISAHCADKVQIQLWHQMIYSHRSVLANVVKDFEQDNPDVEVVSIYRETEELRSAFQSAAMGGSGPELIFGPSDQIGPFVTMGLLQNLDEVYTQEELEAFDPLSRVKYHDQLYMLGNSVGNFLMLIYNKDYIQTPPKTLEEFIRVAQENTIINENGSGNQRYGLAFNYTEPFFFVPWVTGFGEHFIKNDNIPNLATTSMADAFSLMHDFKEKYKIVPLECDYEAANALFKEGRAAMIINGDWSWGDYRAANVNFGIARFPLIEKSGKYPAPLVGTTGYSLNKNISSPAKKEASLKLLRYLTSEKIQTRFTKEISTFPSRLKIRETALVTSNPILNEASKIMETGRPMPVVPEVRAIWDSLRGLYQSVLAGTMTPEKAASEAQEKAEKQILQMNEVLKPDASLTIIYIVFAIAIAIGLFYFTKSLRKIVSDIMERNHFPYFMILPAYLGILSVVLFPFVYNILLSFSNFSLHTFENWNLIGIHHYIEVLTDPKFYEILVKTIIWTLTNVFFHVSIGVILAVIIEQVMPKKNIWRTILIIPWAIPQYITALTWRGMFNQEYGPINIFLHDYLKLSPIQWLSQPLTTFAACLLTNVWLGFPFMMIVALGGLQSIPKSVYESAELDGANPLQKFFHITWPMLTPVIKPAALLGCIWTFNTLNVIWLVSNSGEPADQTHILVSYVYKAAFNLYRYGYSAALSVVIFVILVFASLGANYINKKSTKAEF